MPSTSAPYPISPWPHEWNLAHALAGPQFPSCCAFQSGGHVSGHPRHGRHGTLDSLARLLVWISGERHYHGKGGKPCDHLVVCGGVESAANHFLSVVPHKLQAGGYAQSHGPTRSRLQGRETYRIDTMLKFRTEDEPPALFVLFFVAPSPCQVVSTV